MKIECVSPESWFNNLLHPDNEFHMNTCRCDRLNSNWNIPRWIMEEHLVFFLEQGFLGVKLNNRCVRVDPGTAVWIPPGGDRELWGVKSGRFLRYHKMRFNLRKDGREIVFSNKIITRTRIWDIMPYFQLLSREVQDSQPWKEFHIRGLLSAFSVLFIRAESRRDDDSVRRFNSAQRSLVNRYILDNIHTELTVGGMSASLMLSRDYFSRVFRNTYGMPPRAYIKKERIRYATVRLTESNVSVKEAANELNYDNVNLFCRQFKDVTGLTPTQYRCKYPANVF